MVRSKVLGREPRLTPNLDANPGEARRRALPIERLTSISGKSALEVNDGRRLNAVARSSRCRQFRDDRQNRHVDAVFAEVPPDPRETAVAGKSTPSCERDVKTIRDCCRDHSGTFTAFTQFAFFVSVKVPFSSDPALSGNGS